MKLNFSLAGVLVLMLCAITRVQSQTALDLPYASQAAQVKQRVGVTDITITYHRPVVNGRKIWGGLVPTGQVWRAGANENTTIEFSTPVSIEGKPLPAGTYGLHMIPNADTWTVIFSKMAVAWGSYTYNQSEDALRVDVKPHPTEMEEALEDGLKWADLSIQNEERFENLSTKADLLQAMNRTDEAKKVRDHAMGVASPIQLYSYARGLQAQNRSDEAMAIFKTVAAKAPETVPGHLASARLKSAAGDFDGALVEAKAAETAATIDAQKQNIRILIGRLQSKQDINK